MMNDNPLVTVYTITRNRADLLPRAMKSVLSQTYKNIEYIIIDSASTDETEKIVKSFNDERIRYVKLEENKTFGSCINLAFELSTGEYVTELDDDDEYHLDKIEKQVKLFQTLPEDYGMIYCWMTYYDSQTGKFIENHMAELRGDIGDEVVATNNVSGTPTLMLKRTLFNNVGKYKLEEEIGVESDWEFAARVCQYCKVDYVSEFLVNIYVNHSHKRMSDAGYYQDYSKKRIRFHEYFLNEFADVFKRHTRRQCPHFLRLTVFSWRAKEYGKSVKYAVKYVGYKLFGSK